MVMQGVYGWDITRIQSICPSDYTSSGIMKPIRAVINIIYQRSINHKAIMQTYGMLALSAWNDSASQ